jgi:hypothetical protein
MLHTEGETARIFTSTGRVIAMAACVGGLKIEAKMQEVRTGSLGATPENGF